MYSKDNNKTNFFKELGLSIFIGVVIFGILYIFLWVDKINSDNFKYFFGFSMLYAIGGYLSNKYLAIYLNKIIPWNKQPKKRLLYGIIGSIAITVLIFIVLNYIQVAMYTGKGFIEYFEAINFSHLKMPIYITTVILLSFYSFFFYKELQETKLNEIKLKAEKTKAKYNALKSQIDPHFLFNNLNVLFSIIDENPKNAKVFVKNLSSIYRYILEHKESDLTSLSSEIDFAKKYLELLEFRFEGSLSFILELSDGDKEIIPLATQTLLENAIKHNNFTDEKPLVIKIYDQNNYLIVENNYNPSLNEDGTKHGLKSINGRCMYLIKKEIIVEQTSDKFIVKVPLMFVRVKLGRLEDT